MSGYSLDLRERVVAAVEEGSSMRGAAEQFSISASAAIKWMQRLRRTGSVAATPRPKSHKSKVNDEKAWLLALVEIENDLTLEEIAARLLAERGVQASISSIQRFYARNRVSYKKKDDPRGRTRPRGRRPSPHSLERSATRA